jgi:hypothetical protein
VHYFGLARRLDVPVATADPSSEILVPRKSYTELSPVLPGQVPSYLGLTCGERPRARFDSAVARPRLKATGDPEDDEEEEEEEEKKKREDDEEKEENDGEDDEEPLQVADPRYERGQSL